MWQVACRDTAVLLPMVWFCREALRIDEEIEQEVLRFEQRFARPQPRLFPVSVMYVVPGYLR